MESAATLLIVLFQLFFGWCEPAESGQPPAPQCQDAEDC